jgi:predicted O-methyltransferase YrrM
MTKGEPLFRARQVKRLMNKATSNDPAHILQIGMGFLASKTLLSAVELELFTHLGSAALNGAQIGKRLGLHARGLFDFLDALVALGILERTGDGPEGRYSNTPQSAAFLDKKSPTYVGGILEMANARLYRFWGDLTTALKTGQPQSEMKSGGGSPFEALYADEGRLEQFLNAMQGVQTGNFRALAAKVDLGRHETLLDIGGANAFLSTVMARKYPKLNCISFDLPQVAPIARRRIAELDLGERVKIASGNFFTDVLPRADVITMGNILHDWDEEQKRALIAKAYAALNPDGFFIAIESVIDDARRSNTFGLLMSLNMLIEMPGGFDYTGAQFDGWCKAAGFKRTEVIALAGPSSAAIAYK